MKQYELIVGQPVWWQRQRSYTGAPVTKTPALVALPPNAHRSLVGIALRRPSGDDWYPMWCAPRNLAWRDVTTETIPAFFAAVKDEAHRRVETIYSRLSWLARPPITVGFQRVAAQAQLDLAAMEHVAGEMGLIFRKSGPSFTYALLPMTDCEFDAFVAATHAENEVAR